MATALILCTLIVAAVFGLWATRRWALKSPQFALRTVTFSGLSRVGDVELRRVAAIGPGQNLFQLDLSGLERALATHPWVKSARVTRRWPNAISVHVEERKAAALASLGELYLVDEGGEPFKRIDVEDAVDLPLITGMTREEYVAAPADGAGRLRDAISLVERYEKRGRGKLSEVRLGPVGAVVVAEDGLEIHLGERDVNEQLARLDRVQQELSRRSLGAAVIRLDDRERPGRAAVKLAAASPVATSAPQ
ncbi:MAG: cell division protein FtsQ/DivIB [Myxococcaceae bacterium]